MRTSEHGRKGRYVIDINPNEYIDGIFVVTQAQQFQAKNGPFWRLTLQDATGQIEGKVWSPLAQEFSEFITGALYVVEGKSSLYKDKVEVSLTSVTYLPEEAVIGIDLADFVAVSPYPVGQMLAELQELFHANITHPPLLRFFALLLDDEDFRAKFAQAPAAKAMHHAYAGGLLEHTLSICRLCMSIADNYPHVDRQILLAGALCHDLGKIWELTSGLAIDYTDEGRLVGHISLGLERITPYMESADLEREHIMHIQHLILSHHGAYEYGAPRLPATAEAFILHFADNIDAKIQQVSQALEGDMKEPHWSNYVRGLDRQVYQAAQVESLAHEPTAEDGSSALPSGGSFSEESVFVTSAASSSEEVREHSEFENTESETQLFDEKNHALQSEDHTTLVAAEDNALASSGVLAEEGDSQVAVGIEGSNGDGQLDFLQTTPPVVFFGSEDSAAGDASTAFSDTAYMDSLLKDSNEAYLVSNLSPEDDLSETELAGEETGFGWSVEERATEPLVDPVSLDEPVSPVSPLDDFPLENDASFKGGEAHFTPRGSDGNAPSDSAEKALEGNAVLLKEQAVSLPGEEGESVEEQAKTGKKVGKKRAQKTEQSELSEDGGELESLPEQKTKPTPRKQSSLPLLEQCSLLSKE